MTLELYAILIAVFLGGLIKGLEGFGYAVISTSILAAFIDPAEAIIILIIPLIVAEFDMVSELSATEFRSCMNRFYPYLVAAFVGTIIGIGTLELIPARIVSAGLGIITLGFVGSHISHTAHIFESFGEKCFKDNMHVKTVLGLLSGIIFGATNIAVQIVAYLESLDLDRETFVGLLAMIMIGISSTRIIMSVLLDLYTINNLGLSLFAIIPGLVGVTLGDSVAHKVPSSLTKKIAFLLLTIIGLKLLLGPIQI